MPAHAARRTVLQKVRGRALPDTSTACGHRVSGSLSLPSRGSFHLSLMVLFSTGHQAVFRLAGWSPRLPPGFLVSRRTPDPVKRVFPPPTGLSPSPAGLPRTFRLGSPRSYDGPYPGVHALRFGLLPFRSPLLRESIFLSFPPATWMFRFAGFPSAHYGFMRGCTGASRAGFPIQTPADHRVCAPPRSFSQLVASFIGSWCQGIRPVPFMLDLFPPVPRSVGEHGPRFFSVQFPF